jgi:hypothetical protein
MLWRTLKPFHTTPLFRRVDSYPFCPIRYLNSRAELARRLAEVTGNRSAELQKLRTEKEELVVRLEEYRKNASATLENAKQQERLAAERELQEQAGAMTRRIAELEAAQKFAEEQRKAEVARARAELEAALSGEKARANDLARQGKDYLQEIGGLRQRNRELEAEMAKVSRVGKREEIDFAEEARSGPGICVGEKLPRNGDYLMAFADAAGNALEPAMVVDNKDKAVVAQSGVRKLVRDAKERKLPVAALVTREESQLRHVDRQGRWGQEDGIWLLRSTRAWLPRDLEVLSPVFERMRTEGPDFLHNNAALADEVRRTLADIDEIDSHLKRAGAAIEKAQALTAKHRARLVELCDSVAATGMTRGTRHGRVSAGNGNGNSQYQQANQQEE